MENKTLSSIIEGRRSVRKFKPDPVSDSHINEILTAAMFAPSACNTRPWRFVVVKDRELLDKISERCPNAHMLKTAPLGIVVVAMPGEQAEKCPGYFPQDCGAAIQNMLLKGAELGLGSCWCGIWPRAERVLDMQEILQERGVFDPQTKDMPFAVIAFGTAAEQPKTRGFFDPERVQTV
jgi:nitroreductase